MGGLPTTDEWAKDSRSRGGARVTSLEDRIAALESARQFVFAAVQIDLNNTNLPTSFTTVVSQTYVVPNGYSQAIVAVTATAGASFTGASGSGVVGIAPNVAGTYSPGTSSGIPGQGSVTTPCTQAVQLTGLGASMTISAQAYAAASGLSVVASSGNAHVTGFIIFLR